MYPKKQTSQKERVKKILSFAVAAMNATNVLMPVAIPYVHIAKSVQCDVAATALAQASVEHMHLGMQILDQMIFSKAEAFTSPVENGEVVYEEIVSAGSQTILNGGTAIAGSIMKSGEQIISSGGVASNTIINIDGVQTVSLGGTAIATTLSERRTYQVISTGGTALFTTLNNEGFQHVLGGTAISTTVNEFAQQAVISGGSAIATVVNRQGTQLIVDSSCVAIETTINNGGLLAIYEGGTALNITQNSGGNIRSYLAGGDTKTIVNGTNENGSFSLANGTATNFILYHGGYQHVQSGGTSLSATINSGALHTTSSGGTSLNITQNSGGNVRADITGGDTKTIVTGTNEKGAFSLANGIASNFVLNSGGGQYVYSGGTALSTTINSGGSQTVSAGGTSLNIIQNSGGNVGASIKGGDTKTIVNGSNENGSFSVANGTAANLILYSGGYQSISSGGTALATTVNSGGLQVLYPGGTSLNITQNSGGNIIASIGGGDTKTIANGSNANGAFSLANGTATNFIVYSGAYQSVGSGGTALSTIISSGGAQVVSSGGTSLNITQNSGGKVSVDVIGGDNKTIVTGINENGAFSLANGTATNFVINNGGGFLIAAGGSSISTTINSTGFLGVYAGGVAISTTINSAGMFYLYDGGTALNIVQNSGGNIRTEPLVSGNTKRLASGTNEKGAFSLANGIATNFIIYSNGGLYIYTGGSAVSTTINSGGSQNISGGKAISTMISAGGEETVVFGGTATETAVYSGAQQNIHDAGLAISTTVNDGGSIYVHDGGSAANAVVNSGGIMYGQSNGTISDAAINSGGTLLLFRGAIVNSVSNSGTIDASKFNNGTIGALAGSNGVVLFNSDPYTPVIYNQVLNLGSISGSQTFDIAVDLKNNTADNLVIAGDASGTHYIKVTKEASPGSALSSLKGATTVVTVLGKDTSEFLGAQSSIDGLKIQPNVVHNDRFWQIDGYSVIGVSDLSKVAAASADLNYAALYSGDSILRTRMGDIKDNLKSAGIWAKLSGGELAIDSNTLKHATFQGGYDKVHTGNNGTTVTGIMFERMEGSTTYTANGDGKLNNTRVGLYHTWFGNSGQYYDIVLKTGSIRNDINVYESEAVKGNYSAWNSSISFEYGNKKQLKNGYYINPLAKLSLGRINGSTYTTNSDTLISQDGINSVLGRIGIGIGKNAERGRWYFNTAIVHEFTAKSKVTTGQGKFASTIENSLKGTALELSLGTSVQVSKSGLLYTDITKSFGGKVINKWQLQAGFRASF